MTSHRNLQTSDNIAHPAAHAHAHLRYLIRRTDVYRTSFWQGVCKVIRHPWFEYGVDAVLILNSVLLVLESAEALSGTPVAPNQGNGGAQVCVLSVYRNMVDRNKGKVYSFHA